MAFRGGSLALWCFAGLLGAGLCLDLSSCGLKGGLTSPSALGGARGQTIVLNRILPSKPLHVQSRACVGHTSAIPAGSFTDSMICVEFPDRHDLDFLPVPPSIDKEGLAIAFVRQAGTKSYLCMESLEDLRNNTNKGVTCSDTIYSPVLSPPYLADYTSTLTTSYDGGDESRSYIADYRKMREGTSDGINTANMGRADGEKKASFLLPSGDGELLLSYWETSGNGLQQEVCVFTRTDPDDVDCGYDFDSEWISTGLSYDFAKSEHLVWGAERGKGFDKVRMCSYPVDGYSWSSNLKSGNYNCSNTLVFDNSGGVPLAVERAAMRGSPVNSSAVMMVSGKAGGFGEQWSAVCWADDEAGGAVNKPLCRQFQDAVSPVQGRALPVSDATTTILPFNNGTVCRIGRGETTCVDLLPLQPGSSPSISRDSSTWAVGGIGPDLLVCAN